MQSKLWCLSLISLFCVSLSCLTGCGSTGSGKFTPSESSYEAKFLAFSDGSSELRVKGASVTQSFFAGAGEQALLGRLFITEEFAREGRRVALIGKEFWVRHFKSDPSIIGKSVAIDGVDFTVIGVLPDSYNVPTGAEVWIPKF